jgi:hypothetical protein
MLPRVKFMLLPAVLPCLLFFMAVDAAAQNGRLLGTVAVAYPGRYPVAARGVRVIAAGGYAQAETRTDGNGNFALILRPGTYRVLAQASGYSLLRESAGYVRAYTDSVISPNPLYLVPSRSTDPMVLSGPTAAHQNVLTLDVAAQNNYTGELRGHVRYKDTDTPARGVRVVAMGSYAQGETRTDNNGNFALLLRAGVYRVVVQGQGYMQGWAQGRVRPNAESEIMPNPIYLVPLPPPPQPTPRPRRP